MTPETPLRLLVVDDEPAILRTLCSFLRLQGYHCDGESDPEAAVERALAGDYHIVITDLAMPRLDGLELVRTLKREGCLAEIIVITAYSTLDRALEAYSLGVADYLLKPFENLSQVGQVIDAAAERHRRWRKALAHTIQQGE